MCLLIAKPANVELDIEAIIGGWSSNRDGAGVAFAYNGFLHITKGLMSQKALLKHTARIPKRAVAIVHLRLATSGKKDPRNTHPWSLQKGTMALAHNGVLRGLGDEKTSDTGYFAAMLDTAITLGTILNAKGTLEWLEKLIAGDKMTILDKSGELIFLNEKLGHWRDGCWYSNHSYEYSYWEEYYDWKRDLPGGSLFYGKAASVSYDQKHDPYGYDYINDNWVPSMDLTQRQTVAGTKKLAGV